MEHIKLPAKFREEAFDRVDSFLRYGGIESALARDVISADFVDILGIASHPSRTPLIDFSRCKSEPSGLRDSAYFWGGIFPESLRKTNLTPRDFANTLDIVYSHLQELYGPVIGKSPRVLEAFHEAYQSFSEGERRRLLH